MDPDAALHPDLHPPSVLAPSRVLAPARAAALALVDVEVALNSRQAGPVALLVVLAVLANVGALVWLWGRSRAASWQPPALMLMAFSGGLLAALQHGSPALAFPGVAAAQVVADGSVLEVLATGALALIGLEAGVVGADLGASAALGYPAIFIGAGLLGLTRRQ